MINHLKIKNFTILKQADIKPAAGLNIIIGENGTGKSHILKLIYTVLANSAEQGKKPSSNLPTKTLLQKGLAEKLVSVFRPESLGHLTSKKQRQRCEIKTWFANSKLNIDFSFASQSKSEVIIEKLPDEWIDKAPVFLPSHELLTIYPKFVSFYESHYLEFEETFRDTCLLLGRPSLRNMKGHDNEKILKPLESAMGGSIGLNKNGRFYLRIPKQGTIEMPLVAEGLRKLAMVSQLIINGSLLKKGYLFWDEPESNLNALLIKLVAQTILDISKNGIQVFIATHNLFLMREIEILLQTRTYKKIPFKVFGLLKKDDQMTIHQGNTFDDLPVIVALDEELNQSDRFMET